MSSSLLTSATRTSSSLTNYRSWRATGWRLSLSWWTSGAKSLSTHATCSLFTLMPCL
jgi:hypothetical protein